MDRLILKSHCAAGVGSVMEPSVVVFLGPVALPEKNTQIQIQQDNNKKKDVKEPQKNTAARLEPRQRSGSVELHLQRQHHCRITAEAGAKGAGLISLRLRVGVCCIAMRPPANYVALAGEQGSIY